MNPLRSTDAGWVGWVAQRWCRRVSTPGRVEGKGFEMQFGSAHYAVILENISAVNMNRYTHSHTSMKPAFHVQHGSSGDSHAIV